MHGHPAEQWHPAVCGIRQASDKAATSNMQNPVLQPHETRTLPLPNHDSLLDPLHKPPHLCLRRRMTVPCSLAPPFYCQHVISSLRTFFSVSKHVVKSFLRILCRFVWHTIFWISISRYH